MNRIHIHNRLKKIPASLVVLLILFSCSGEKPVVVAKFGKQSITLREFRMSYLEIIKQPRIFDSEQLREEFLDELIQRRILAQQARRLKLDSDEYLQTRINAYRDKCLRDAHYLKVISPQIQISEADIEEAYQFTQEQRRIRHLFTETREEADSLFQLLKSGTDFKDLAREVFKDAVLADNGGDLGWVDWAQMEYNLAMTAFRQPLDKISEPVHSQYGWHIIQVTDYRKNPLITRQQYELHRRKAKSLLEQKIGDRMAAEQLQSLMENTKITVFPKVMKPVGEALEAQLKRKPSRWDAMHEMQLSDTEVHAIQTSLWDRRDEKIGEVNGRTLTVGAFISALSFVPYDVACRSFKSALDFVFRDVAITQEAESMGLQRSDSVKLKTALYKEYMLQAKVRKILIKNVDVTDEEVRNIYNSKSRFQNIPYDSVKTYIRKERIKEKRRQIIPRFVREQLNGIRVEKYPERIHAYYDSVYNSASPRE